QRRDSEISGGSRHQPSRSGVPSPGRWTGQTATHPVTHEHATVDWSTYPLRTPSGGGLAPTPDRSKYPARWTMQKGIDQSRPVTEGWVEAHAEAVSRIQNSRAPKPTALPQMVGFAAACSGQFWHDRGKGGSTHPTNYSLLTGRPG